MVGRFGRARIGAGKDLRMGHDHLLGAADYDHNEALKEILVNETTQKFFDVNRPDFPPEDPILCLQRNIHEFILKARREGDLVVVRKTSV